MCSPSMICERSTALVIPPSLMSKGISDSYGHVHGILRVVKLIARAFNERSGRRRWGWPNFFSGRDEFDHRLGGAVPLVAPGHGSHVRYFEAVQPRIQALLALGERGDRRAVDCLQPGELGGHLIALLEPGGIRRGCVQARALDFFCAGLSA